MVTLHMCSLKGPSKIKLILSPFTLLLLFYHFCFWLSIMDGNGHSSILFRGPLHWLRGDRGHGNAVARSLNNNRIKIQYGALPRHELLYSTLYRVSQYYIEAWREEKKRRSQRRGIWTRKREKITQGHAIVTQAFDPPAATSFPGSLLGFWSGTTAETRSQGKGPGNEFASVTYFRIINLSDLYKLKKKTYQIDT